MSSVEDTQDALCVILEGYTGGELDELAGQLIVAIDALGNDLLDHLDPPLGLRTWLSAHGLSLVHTRQVSPPAIWDALQGETGGEDEPLEEERGGTLLLQVGGLIEYRTAPSGPRNQSYVGSGRIIALLEDDGVMVETGPDEYGSTNTQVYVNAATDFIRLLSQPDAP